MIITIENKELTAESKKTIEHCKEKKLYFKKIQEYQARSIPQLQKYWSHDIKVYASNVSGYDDLIKIDNSGHFDYRLVHRKLTLQWCLDWEHPELIETYMAIIDGHYEKVAVVSISFEKMSQKQMNDFMDYVHKSYFYHTGRELDMDGYEQI
jgi:hypothetical protein